MHKLEWDLVPFWDGLPRWLGYDHWDWGIAAEWVAGIATIVAVYFAAKAFYSEVQRSHRAQADLVGVSFTKSPNVDWRKHRWGADEQATITGQVENGSDRPLKQVTFIYPYSRRFMKQDRKDFLQDRKSLWKMADVGKRQFLIDIRNYLFFHRVFKLHREVWSELPAEKTFPLSNSDYWRSEIAVVVMFRDFNGRTWVKDLKSGEYLSGRKARKYK